MKKRYIVGNHHGEWCVRTRDGGGLMFTGTLPECHAWVILMDKGYF
jgi:hypothetical protein